MKIAYIILAHKLPEQVLRLVHKLNGENATFLIHIDKKADQAIFSQITAALSKNANVYFLDRLARYYGDFNHVKATLYGIDKLFELNIQFDYVMLSTGQDYPIKSNQEIQSTLQSALGSSFIEYFALPSDQHWETENGGLDRLNYYYIHWYGWEFPFLQRRGFLKRLPDFLWLALEKMFPLKRSIPGNYLPYGGSAYWCLSRACIEYIREFVGQNAKFARFFEHVKIPEEIFFQTILMNSSLRDRLVNDNLRYIVWSASRHPAILRREDFKIFMDTKKLFARKFDSAIDTKVLDMIDESISSYPDEAKR